LQNLPIALLTGSLLPEDEARATALGATAFFQKAHGLPDVMAFLRSQLGSLSSD
jgi:hypothetical protein